MAFKVLLPSVILLTRLLACSVYCHKGYTFMKDSVDDSDLLEPPLPLNVPLPEECTVAGTNTRTYNQGQCSRRPCRTAEGVCSESWLCCYKVGQMSTVNFTCSSSLNHLQGSVIVMCKCQVCDKLHAQIRGTVLSSYNRKPVVLAAIMIGNEIATFTNQDGVFFFELTTSNREVTLLFQEAAHRQLTVKVDIQNSLTPEIVVVMEYIEAIINIDKLQLDFTVMLSSKDVLVNYGVNASLYFPPSSLVYPLTNDPYTGPGKVLHSLYHTDSRPAFSSEAVSQMVYRDSNGADFSIQSYVIGSLEVVGENGHQLSLRSGRQLELTVGIKFDVPVKESDIATLHLFVYSESGSRWIDRGKMAVMSVQPIEGEYGSWVTLHGFLRLSNSLWTIGFPNRVSCYVKTRVSHSDTEQELIATAVTIEQTDNTFNRPTFYQFTTTTTAGVGVCLKSVCALGGILYVSESNDITITEAIAPNSTLGIIMGKKDEIMFYNVPKTLILTNGDTPYYLTEEACMQNIKASTGFFEFTRNTSLFDIVHPSIMPLVQAGGESPTEPSEYCFIKVAVYDCAHFSEVKVLSYSPENHDILLSMYVDVVTPPAHSYTSTACASSSIIQLRATCVEFTCESDVHVSVQSRTVGVFNEQVKDCRYWSSLSTDDNGHPSEAMTAFHLRDKRTSGSSGIFRGKNRELTEMKCNSGNSESPETTVNPYRGTAVTFTCQF